MKNKYVQIIFIAIFSCFIFGLFYTLFPSEPKKFITDQQIKNEVKKEFPKATVKEVQDIVYIDESHVFVPFITTSETYGMSFWKWKHKKWHVSRIDSRGAHLLVWKIDPKDPASYVIVWNMNPTDQLGQLKVRMTQKRNAGVENYKDFYYPKIQMEKKFSLTSKTYGIFRYPSEWTEMYKLNKNINNVEEAAFIDTGFFESSGSLNLTWTVYNKIGKEVLPEYSLNSEYDILDDETYGYIMIDTDKEVEASLKEY